LLNRDAAIRHVPATLRGRARRRPTAGALANVPLAEGPCPSCTALIDMWDGTMQHFEGLGGNLA
jgi:hypothetical protein